MPLTSALELITHMSVANSRSTVLGAILLAIVACGSGTFDFGEKLQVKYFVNASNLYLNASDYRREIFEEDQPERLRVGTVTEEKLAKLIEKLSTAHNEMKKVSPVVLNKIHPGLADAVSQMFIPAVEKQIVSYSSDDFDECINTQIEGMALHNEWIKWLKPRQNKLTLK